MYIEICAIVDKSNVVSVTTVYMLINCIVANVDLSAWIPTVEWRLGLIKDLAVLLVPMHLFLLCQLIEVALSVLGCILIEVCVVSVFKLYILSDS